jgi:hypothetical protein
LIALLDEPDGKIRQVAAAVLGAFGDDATTAIPSLIKIIEQEKGGTRAAAFNGLAEIGEAGWSEVIKLQSHSDPDVRLMANAVVDLHSVKRARRLPRPDPKVLAAQRPKHEVIEEQITGDGESIEVAILTPLPIDAQGVQAALKAEANWRILSTPWCKAVAVRVFVDRSRFHADRNLWIGWLLCKGDPPLSQISADDMARARGQEGKLPSPLPLDAPRQDKYITLRVEEGSLKALSEPTAVRFGLTESQRKALFKDLWQAGEEAELEAERRYPTKGGSDAQLRASVRLEEEIKKKREDQIRLKYGIDRVRTEDLTQEEKASLELPLRWSKTLGEAIQSAVEVEGYQKQWPH